MWFCGFSLDNLSLMALTIGTGFVVDDAIVMIENIVRHIEEGESPLRGGLRGAREIGFTVISLTVSLIAVFIPLLFMTGLVGRMFREFALTLTIAVVASAVVSLTLTPMMCGRLLRRRRAQRPGRRWPARFSAPGSTAPSTPIAAACTGCCAARRRRCCVTLTTVAGTVVLYIVDAEGLPAAAGHRPDHRGDRGRRRCLVQPRWQRCSARVAEAIRADPDVVGVASVVGVGTVNPTPNAGRLSDRAASRATRARPASAPSSTRLQASVAGIPGMTVYFQPVQDIQIGDPRQPRAVPIHAGRHRPGEVADWAGKLTAALRSAPALRDVASEAQEGGAARAWSMSTARRPAGSACPCRRSTTRSTTPSASGRSPPSTPRPTSTASCWRRSRSYQQDPAR